MDFPLMGVVLQEEASLTGMVLGEEALARLEVAMVLREEEDILDDKATSINDNIHGFIQVPPVLRAIIDTPQFDR